MGEDARRIIGYRVQNKPGQGSWVGPKVYPTEAEAQKAIDAEPTGEYREMLHIVPVFKSDSE